MNEKSSDQLLREMIGAKRRKLRLKAKMADAGTGFIVFCVLAMVGTAVNMFMAQLVCFGLSFFHVYTGLWGPFFLVVAAEGVLASGTAGGRSRSR